MISPGSEWHRWEPHIHAPGTVLNTPRIEAIAVTDYYVTDTEDEKRLLSRMRDWAQKASHRTDAKAKAILDWIEANLKSAGAWNDRRVILFTEYRTTHQWLHQILAANGYGGDRLELIHGGMDQEEREKVKAAFQTNPKDAAVRILLATDAASEGIDLQNYCNCLIHIEIPYNPNVMEQRNGRIDRHGQKYGEVLIWHPVDGGEASGDSFGGHRDDIIRALTKLEAMREDRPGRWADLTPSA
jgi:superfamily II DNA/RNA helicase